MVYIILHYLNMLKVNIDFTKIVRENNFKLILSILFEIEIIIFLKRRVNLKGYYAVIEWIVSQLSIARFIQFTLWTLSPMHELHRVSSYYWVHSTLIVHGVCLLVLTNHISGHVSPFRTIRLWRVMVLN